MAQENNKEGQVRAERTESDKPEVMQELSKVASNPK